jgi:hypothetical protein
MTNLQLIAECFKAIQNDGGIKTITAFEKLENTCKHRVRVTASKCRVDSRVTIGKPNYRECEFLKKCKIAKCNPKRTWISSRYKK